MRLKIVAALVLGAWVLGSVLTLAAIRGLPTVSVSWHDVPTPKSSTVFGSDAVVGNAEKRPPAILTAGDLAAESAINADAAEAKFLTTDPETRQSGGWPHPRSTEPGRGTGDSSKPGASSRPDSEVPPGMTSEAGSHRQSPGMVPGEFVPCLKTFTEKATRPVFKAFYPAKTGSSSFAAIFKDGSVKHRDGTTFNPNTFMDPRHDTHHVPGLHYRGSYESGGLLTTLRRPSTRAVSHYFQNIQVGYLDWNALPICDAINEPRWMAMMWYFFHDLYYISFLVRSGKARIKFLDPPFRDRVVDAVEVLHKMPWVGIFEDRDASFDLLAYIADVDTSTWDLTTEKNVAKRNEPASCPDRYDPALLTRLDRFLPYDTWIYDYAVSMHEARLRALNIVRAGGDLAAVCTDDWPEAVVPPESYFEALKDPASCDFRHVKYCDGKSGNGNFDFHHEVVEATCGAHDAMLVTFPKACKGEKGLTRGVDFEAMLAREAAVRH